MDPIEKAKQGMGKVERAISGLPGVEGYREKEMRRDADKQVRETLAHKLEEVRRRLTELQSEMLSSGGLAYLDDVERAGTRVQTLVDRIRTASYGYAGFFDLQRVKEAELDKLAAYDKGLYEQLPAVDEAMAGLAKAAGEAGGDGVKAALAALNAAIGKLSDDFGRRAEAMHESY